MARQAKMLARPAKSWLIKNGEKNSMQKWKILFSKKVLYCPNVAKKTYKISFQCPFKI